MLTPDPRVEYLGTGVSGFQIALDDTYVYVADRQGLARLPKVGGGQPAVLHAGVVRFLTVDADFAYWSEVFGSSDGIFEWTSRASK